MTKRRFHGLGALGWADEDEWEGRLVKRIGRTLNPAILLRPNGQVRGFSEWGGYPIFYVTADNGVLSAETVDEHYDRASDPDDPQWYVVGHGANYENCSLYDDHTGDRIDAGATYFCDPEWDDPE